MPWGHPLFGAMFHAGRAKMSRRVSGKKREDFDGVECLRFFFPLVPLRPVHVWNWGIEDSESSWLRQKLVTRFSWRAMPIRWSWYVMARAILRTWLWIPLIAGILFGIFPLLGSDRLPGDSVLYSMAACGMAATSLGGLIALYLIDLGQADIRRLLGRHRLGVSDPATWTDDLLQLVAPAPYWFGVATFAEAVDVLLEERRYGEAMWAARLCHALESESEGQRLTSRLLNDPDVRAVLRQIQARPGEYKEITNRRHTSDFPILRDESSPAGKFWRSMIENRSKETLTWVQYNPNVIGYAAYAADNEKYRDRKRRGPPAPPGQLGPLSAQFRIGGTALIGAVVLWVGLLMFWAVLLKPAQPDWVREHERQMQAAFPPAPAQPAKQPDPPAPAPKPPVEPPSWAKPEPGNWDYLADMQAFDIREGAWKFTSDGTVDDMVRSPIAVKEFRSPKGLAMHPKFNDYVSVKYRLDGKYERFRSGVAINDTGFMVVNPMVFEIWGDGKMLWQSEPFKDRYEAREVSIDVKEVEVIELRAVSKGSNYCHHAVWLEAQVRRK